MKDPLPDKVSELIRVALVDLKKCIDDPDYEIDMDRWLARYQSGRCTVCLAAAVMVKSLDTVKTVTGEMTPSVAYGVRSSLRDKLLALNCFRVGNIDDGFRELMRVRPSSIPEYYPISREINQMIVDLESLAKLLESHGE